MLSGARSPRCHPPFLLLQLLLRSKRPLPGRHLAFLLPNRETEAWLLRFGSPAPKSLVILPKKPPQGKEESVPFSTADPAPYSPCVTFPNCPVLFFFFLFAGEKALLQDSCCIFLPQITLNTEKKPYPYPKKASCMLTPGGFLLGDVAGEDLGSPGVILHTHTHTKATPCHLISMLFSTGDKTSQPHCSSGPPSNLPVKPSAILNGGRSP